MGIGERVAAALFQAVHAVHTVPPAPVFAVLYLKIACIIIALRAVPEPAGRTVILILIVQFDDRFRVRVAQFTQYG